MECKSYEQLKRDWRSAQEEWAYFAYPQNKALRGVSDRESKQLAKEAKGKMSEASRRAFSHRETREACRAPGDDSSEYIRSR
jgi:hypothetical protein